MLPQIKKKLKLNACRILFTQIPTLRSVRGPENYEGYLLITGDKKNKTGKNCIDCFILKIKYYEYIKRSPAKGPQQEKQI
jgi:hypothetical protein